MIDDDEECYNDANSLMKPSKLRQPQTLFLVRLNAHPLLTTWQRSFASQSEPN